MKKLFFQILLLACACSPPDKKIINPIDYKAYLQGTNIFFTSQEETLDFWQQRNKANPEDQIALLKLAGLYSARFKSQSKIHDIHLSDSLYTSVLHDTPFGKAGIYQGLAANAITQHQFRKANEYLKLAIAEGEKKAASYMMLADVRMELGDIQGAKTILSDIKNKNAFAFLIRDAKIKDKEGKLDTAILLMEKAVDRIGQNKSLYCWTQSNLADMYGHAGRIEEAYTAYLNVLQVDHSYLYALKGIAWIAFSHDHNTQEAKRIVQFIQTQKPSPDLDLLLATIAGYENDRETKDNLLALFKTEVADVRYGAMYNKYMTLLETDEFNNPQEALTIANQEVKNRPTVESYDLLAWSLFQNGNTEEAFDVASNRIEGKSFEPEAYYHLGIMYHEVDPDKSKNYLNLALLSSFELGPAITRQIKTTLAD